MDKPFKTTAELIELMESRGLKTDEETGRALARDGYYAIVNGYKGPFLDKNAGAESYKKDAEFKELYALYIMDRDLRAALFYHIALCESTLKTVSTNEFCSRHVDDNEAYLNPGNYRKDRSRLVSTFLEELLKVLGRHPNSKPRLAKDYLEHYKNAHDNIPLWVVMNSLSLTQAFKFYTNQCESVRFAIARRFHDMHAEAFGDKAKRITASSLEKTFDHIKDFRNICAHDERLYCARVDKSKSTNLRRLLSDMRTILTRERCDSLERSLLSCLDSVSGDIHTIEERDIIREMGFSSKREISGLLHGDC